MRTKNPEKILEILNKSPRSCLRMYSVLDHLKEDKVEVFINGTAILIKTWSLMLWAEREKDLIPLLQYITPNDPLHLHCVEYRLLSQLKNYFKVIDGIDECNCWELTELVGEPPHLDSLTLDDATYVNDRWEFKSEHSLDFITACLTEMPSSCYRADEGKPVAYSFCYGQSPGHINMGGLIVDPEYRRRGMGKNLALDLSLKVLLRGKKPVVHIRVDNDISMKLSQQTGFERKEKVFWGKIRLI
ncbi:MAG: GNAT family N-acetyltransferase [Candidatus Hodarchaeales archaeon]